jgi:ribosomal protein RSM22 (predicted rRNA methylase)
MEIPASLREALDNAYERVKPSELAAATRELSLRYREPDALYPFLRSELDVLADGAYRLPATYAAARAVLTEVGDRLPEWPPASVLDLGAGPGTGSWAAIESWPSIVDVELVERDERMSGFGRQLMNEAGGEPLATARWRNEDILDFKSDRPRDLVILSYALGELAPARQRGVLESLWRDTQGVLAVIEPGTPAGFEVIRAARALLIELGAHVAAPCPHALECPMAGGNWCHFSRRLARSRAHRNAKDAAMGYEDEKFSYVAVTRMAVTPTQSRVLRHPQVRPGHIRLELCTPEGLKHRVVSKKDKQQFRAARHAAWGSAFDFGGKGRDPADVNDRSPD